MPKRILLSWSSGKDSAWALHVLRQNPEYKVEGLFCTVNEKFDRVAMHGVRVELLRRQAEGVGLPIELLSIPSPCSNEDYERVMSAFIRRITASGISHVAFGDLFLEDVRRYREDKLAGTGLTAVFPLWRSDTRKLAKQMIKQGVRARLTCVDPKQLPMSFCGREFDSRFLEELPQGIDPCGENGEFHSFVFDGPMFKSPLEIDVGETIEREGFVFTDLLCSTNSVRDW